jgi:hypothetical protein
MRTLLAAAASIAQPNDHVVLLSGQCYPIGGIGRFVSMLNQAQRRQFCRAFFVDEADMRSQRKVTRSHFMDWIPPRGGRGETLARAGARHALTAMSGAARRPVNIAGYRVAFGSQWVALTAECLNDLLAREQDPLLRRLRTSFAPDELYIQTLVHNSDWSHDTQMGGAEPFAGRGNWRLRNFHLIRPELGEVWTPRDVGPKSLVQHAREGCYFLRKVSMPRSAPLLDACDRLAVAENMGKY